MNSLLHITWAAGAYAASFCVFCGLPARYVRRRLPVSMSRLACVSLTAATALAGSVPAYLMTAVLISGTPSHIPFTSATAAAGLVVMTVVTVISVWRRRTVERSLAASRARAQALQTQINPHFFFNTLNTISALIPSDPSGAQKTVARLAEMSRYAFASAERTTVPLAEELQFARAYLDIERTRFGDRLRFDLPDEASVEGLTLPPLTVQPLIENAVRHGIARRPDGGAVTVRVQRSGMGFSVTVENDAEESDGIGEGRFFQPSHALANIRDRLGLLSHGTASIDVAISSPGLVTVTIRSRAQPA